MLKLFGYAELLFLVTTRLFHFDTHIKVFSISKSNRSGKPFLSVIIYCVYFAEVFVFFFYFCSGWLLSPMYFPAGIAFFKRSYNFFILLWHLAGIIKLKSNSLYTHQELTAAKAMLSPAGFPGEPFLAKWFYELYNHIVV